MLVLSRKLGEKIHIGADITITVVEMRGNQIRLGIDAPPASLHFPGGTHRPLGPHRGGVVSGSVAFGGAVGMLNRRE